MAEKKIVLKSRNLKDYRKAFLNKGDFPYSIPSSIPNGHPTVCYDRKINNLANQQDNVLLPPPQPIVHINTVNTPTTSHSTGNVVSSNNHIDNDLLSVGDTENNGFLSIEEMYFHNLKVAKGISIFPGDDSHGSVLVLKDFCTEKKKILNEKYILIERKCVDFNNGHCNWIYWCSCNYNSAKQISSLHYSLNISEAEFSEHYPDCIHVHVAKMIYSHYDLIHEIVAHVQNTDGEDHEYSMAGVKVFEVPESKIVCCGGMGIPRYGLVDFGKKRWACITCSSYTCDHISIIKRIKLDGAESIYYDLIQSITSDQSTSVDGSKVYNPKLISYKKIPFQRSSSLSDKLKSLHIEQHEVLLPDLEICRNCGSSLDEGDPVEENWVAYDHAVVVTNCAIGYAKVYYRPCSSCDVISIFEGQSKCLLNLGTYLVGYDVLRSYMHSFLHGRRPLYTFYQTWCDVHLDYGNSAVQDIFSYQKLRYAWNSFLKLLDIDYSIGFNCPTCDGDNGYPSTIICDGTSLSFQRRMWEWTEPCSTEVLKLSSSGFSDRVFIQDAVIRNLLKRYASAGELTRKVRLKPLNMSEKKFLLAEIKHISPPLYGILEAIELDKSLFKIYQKLLFCLSSPSPVCALLKPIPDVQNLLTLIGKDVQLKEDPKLWTLLHEKIPIVFDIFQQVNPTNELKCLLKELWDIAITPFIDASEDNSLEIETSEDDLSFFPNLPKVRDRGNYPMDKQRSKQRKKEDICNKSYAGHPSLLPGIFTVFCPHGICYGFQVMESNESPNVPFTILRSRFVKAPKVVIYDNACKLQEYCLSRDPLFFQETEFYVDRLHWDNHTSCSLAYELSIYPQYDSINSQINEQANSSLKRIKDQLSYMTAEHFMTHCSFFLWNKNDKIRLLI